MTQTPDQAPAWQRQRPNPLAELFAPGTQVRHLNPRFADWCGTVTCEAGNGRFLRCHDHGDFGRGISTEIHIRWNDAAGAFEGLAWYDIEAIAARPGEFPAGLERLLGGTAALGLVGGHQSASCR